MTFELGVIFCMFFFILWQEVAYRKEVSRLLDRLMSRDLPEFKSCADIKKVPIEPVSMSDRSEYEAYCNAHGITPEKEES